jgi:hypothetical protein
MDDRRAKCNRKVAEGRVLTGQKRRRAEEQRRHPKCERNGKWGGGNEAQRKMKQANKVKKASCEGD